MTIGNAGYAKIPPATANASVPPSQPDDFAPLPDRAEALAPSGDTTGADDRAAIQAALTAGRPVYLVPGATYYLDQTVTLPTGAQLRADESTIVPGSTWAPAASLADDNSVAFFRAASSHAADPITTTNGAVTRHTKTVVCTDASAISIGDWVLVASPNAQTGATPTSTFAASSSITTNSHLLRCGDRVYWTTSGSLPAEIVASRIYYVRSVVDANTITVSATLGGSAIVASGAGSGTHTLRRERYFTLAKVTDKSSNTLTLDRPVRFPHVTASRVYLITSLVRDVDIRIGMLDTSATNHAVGVYLEAVERPRVRATVKGFTRHAVEARAATEGLDVELYGKGTCNSLLRLDAAHECSFFIDTDPSGTRFHTNGVVRGAVVVDGASSNARCKPGTRIRRMCCGFQMNHFYDFQLVGWSVDDIDTTELVTRDTTVPGSVVAPANLLSYGGSKAIGAAVSICALESGANSAIGHGGLIDSFSIGSCRSPNGDGIQAAIYSVDGDGIVIPGGQLTNTGLFSETSGQYAMGGIVLFDSFDTQIGTIGIKGYSRPISFRGGFGRVDIDKLSWDPRDGTSDPGVFMTFGIDSTDDSAGGAEIDIVINRIVMAGVPTGFMNYIDAAKTPTQKMYSRVRVGSLEIKPLHRVWTNCLFARAADPGTVYNMGEICEIRPPVAATFTNSSTAVGVTAHGLIVGSPVHLRTAGTLPTNFAVGTRYFVRAVTDANTITLATTVGGTAITAGSAGSGTHEIAPELIHVRTPTTATRLGKGSMAFCTSTDQGAEFPVDTHLIGFGGSLQEFRMGDSTIALPGDLVEWTSGRTLVVNNASTSPVGIVIRPKVSAVAGRVMVLTS